MFTTLLVDDELISLVSIKASFNWEYYRIARIIETTKSDEALQILHKNRIDVAFIDIRMPQFNGLDIIDICKKAGLKTQFIIITGYSDFSYAKSAIKLGVLDFCLKPVDIDETSELMQNVTNKIRSIRLLNDNIIYSDIKQDNNLEDNLSSFGLDLSKQYYRGIYWQGNIEACYDLIKSQLQDDSIVVFFLDERKAFFIIGLNKEFNIDFSEIKGFSAAVSFCTPIIQNIPQIVIQAEKVMLFGKMGATYFVLTQRSNEHFNNFIEYVNQNYTKDLNLKQISEQFAFSYTYCSDLFTKMTGSSFTVYITNLRINYARKLLVETNHSIQQICFDSGFNDYHYFANVFKKQLNITPSQYREKNRR